MEWSVAMEAVYDGKPLDEAAADEAAEVLADWNGVVGFGGTEPRLDCRFTVEAPSFPKAIDVAEGVFGKAFGFVGPCELVHFEADTMDELERRNEEPNFPQLAGVAEIAGMLKVSRQRASELARHDGFPKPVAMLAAGPVWVQSWVDQFVGKWPRRPGRPGKAPAG